LFDVVPGLAVKSHRLIAAPEGAGLGEMTQVRDDFGQGVVKLTLTTGSGGRLF
jgi:hypothetical protein